MYHIYLAIYKANEKTMNGMQIGIDFLDPQNAIDR
jgi:hypothetical protein